MRKVKTSVLSITIATIVMLAISISISAASLKDASKIPSYAKEAVGYLADKNYVQGDQEGNFNPQATIDRASAAEILRKALKLPVEGTEEFTDVRPSDWFYDSIRATSPEIFKGNTKNQFMPRKNLTRQEAAIAIVDAYGLTGEAQLTFNDTNKIVSWAKKSAEIAVSNGIITGKPGNVFAPTANITRAEYAVMIKRAIDATTDNENPESPETPEVPEAPSVVSVESLELISVVNGQEVNLPETATVSYDNGTYIDFPVIWNTDEVDFTKVGLHEVSGKLVDSELTTMVLVEITVPEIVDFVVFDRSTLIVLFNNDITVNVPLTAELGIGENVVQFTIAGVEYTLTVNFGVEGGELPLLLELNTDYVSPDNQMTVRINSITFGEQDGFNTMTIDYTQKNNTVDQVITATGLKLYFEDGTSEPQYGGFNNLYPGEESTRSYTFKYLKTQTPVIIEYAEENFFAQEPLESSLKWSALK